jgi:hypothetical protein
VAARCCLFATFLYVTVAAAAFGAGSALQSADAKMEKFSKEQWGRGEVVVFTPAEVDAWVSDEVPRSVPQGLRDPKLQLGQDTAVGSALVDFVKLEQARGKTPGLVSKMFQGERPLKISVRLASSAGKCTVYLSRVDLGGASIEGTPLDLLIKTFFRPLYPDAKINEPFDLDYNIDRIELRPEGIRVTIKK